MDTCLFFNGHGRNGPGYDRTVFDSFVVSGGLILQTGFGLETHSAWQDLPRVDLHGQIVLPAFADAHVHFLQTGLTLLGCRLDGAASLDEVADRLRETAARSPDEWVLAWNLDETTLREKRLPTVAEIDRAVPGRKVWVSRVDLHSAIPSSPAAAWARTVRPEAALHHDYFYRDDYTILCSRLMAGLPREMKERALGLARRHCLERGVTTIHALEGGWAAGPDDVQLVADFLVREGFHGLVFHQSEDPGLARRNGWPRLGGCLMVDGSFGSRTAALSSPYADDPSTSGVVYRDAASLDRLVGLCAEQGLQLAMHAIGDVAVELLAKAYRAGRRRYGPPPLPNRIEHAELPTPAAIDDAVEAGALVSVQPAFEVLWGGPSAMYARRLGPERAARTNPFRTLRQRGLALAGGSDSPVTPVDPFLGIHGFVNHPTPSERIDLAAALDAFIGAPHRFAGEDRHRGRLQTGFVADFVCLPADPFRHPAGSLRDLRVSRVFVGGREVTPVPSPEPPPRRPDGRPET